MAVVLTFFVERLQYVIHLVVPARTLDNEELTLLQSYWLTHRFSRGLNYNEDPLESRVICPYRKAVVSKWDRNDLLLAYVSEMLRASRIFCSSSSRAGDQNPIGRLFPSLRYRRSTQPIGLSKTLTLSMWYLIIYDRYNTGVFLKRSSEMKQGYYLLHLASRFRLVGQSPISCWGRQLITWRSVITA